MSNKFNLPPISLYSNEVNDKDFIVKVKSFKEKAFNEKLDREYLIEFVKSFKTFNARLHILDYVSREIYDDPAAPLHSEILQANLSLMKGVASYISYNRSKF